MLVMLAATVSSGPVAEGRPTSSAGERPPCPLITVVFLSRVAMTSWSPECGSDPGPGTLRLSDTPSHRGTTRLTRHIRGPAEIPGLAGDATRRALAERTSIGRLRPWAR